MQYFKYFPLLWVLGIFFAFEENLSITRNERMSEKRLYFFDKAKKIMNKDNLVDQNKKRTNDDSLRTYLFFMTMSDYEIDAVYVYDEFFLKKAKTLGINENKNVENIIDIEKRIEHIIPLRNEGVFEQNFYKGQDIYLYETKYSITNYNMTRFVFTTKITDLSVEELLSIIIGDEMQMKNVKIKIMKQYDGDEKKKKKTMEKVYNSNKKTEIKTNIWNSNNVDMRKSRLPAAFVELLPLIGLAITAVTNIPKIAGAISAVSDFASSFSRPPSPPQFLGNDNVPLSTLPTQISSYQSQFSPRRRSNKRVYEREQDDDENNDNDNYDDENNDNDNYSDDDSDSDDEEYERRKRRSKKRKPLKKKKKHFYYFKRKNRRNVR